MKICAQFVFSKYVPKTQTNNYIELPFAGASTKVEEQVFKYIIYTCEDPDQKLENYCFFYQDYKERANFAPFVAVTFSNIYFDVQQFFSKQYFEAEHVPEKGLFIVHPRNYFEYKALEIIINQLPDKFKEISFDNKITDDAQYKSEVGTIPESFLNEVYDVLKTENKGESITVIMDKAKEIWDSMDKEEKSMYHQSKFTIYNLSLNQTTTKGIEGGEPIKNQPAPDIHLYSASVTATSPFQETLLAELVKECKLLDGEKRLSLYVDGTIAKPPPDDADNSTLTLTSNKINCTREACGDPIDYFLIKPIRVTYETKRKVKAVFWDAGMKDREKRIISELCPQVTIQ